MKLTFLKDVYGSQCLVFSMPFKNFLGGNWFLLREFLLIPLVSKICGVQVRTNSSFVSRFVEHCIAVRQERSLLHFEVP